MPPIIAVRLGTSVEQGYHFLALVLSRQPTGTEIVKICDQLHAHFKDDNGPFMLREFVRNEIHLWPSLKSEMHFKTLRSAIEEYQAVLEVLGLAEWSAEMVFDGDLRPFDERSFSPPPFHPYPSKQLVADGLATCLLP